jgi:hypothetical protein
MDLIHRNNPQRALELALRIDTSRSSSQADAAFSDIRQRPEERQFGKNPGLSTCSSIQGVDALGEHPCRPARSPEECVIEQGRTAPIGS